MELEQELEIVAAAKTNVQEFAKIYDYYIDKIYSYCLNRLASKELAQDVTSAVFTAAVEGIRKFDTSHGVRFGSWLYRVAHNMIVDQYKQQISQVQLEQLEIAANVDNIDESVARELTAKMQVADVLTSINDRYQLVITLKFYSELEIAEIAEVLEIESKNVSVLLHRSLQAFKQEFARRYKKSEIFAED